MFCPQDMCQPRLSLPQVVAVGSPARLTLKIPVDFQPKTTRAEILLARRALLIWPDGDVFRRLSAAHAPARLLGIPVS